MATIRIFGGTILPMTRPEAAHRGELWISQGTILASPPADTSAVRSIDATGCFVLPGFVQAHIHLVQSLIRGEAEDRTLLEWLREIVWPFEAAHDDATLAASARTGLAECIQSGVTTIFDMGTTHGHEHVQREVVASGLRGYTGKAMMDLDLDASAPPRLRETTARSLDESESLARELEAAAPGRLRYCYSPRFALSATAELHREVARRARASGRRVHTHAAEQRSEAAAIERAFGHRCIPWLLECGLDGGGWTLAHAVHLDDDDRAAIRRSGAGVAHCPTSNLKLGSGICNVPALRTAGIPTGLGSDGAPCNNRLDLYRDLSLACLLQKREGNMAALSAYEALSMATIDGARAIGLDAVTGTLEPGKRADVVVIDPRFPSTTPHRDPYATIVHSASPENVRDVLCDGELLKFNFAPVRFDAREVAARADEQAQRLRQRANL
jgi:5-methylthioadenosine/S-adenosylhomocysteine deaminase